MGHAEQSFTIKDRKGTAHRYTFTLHPGSEGTRLAITMGALLIEPLAEAAGPPLLKAISKEGALQGLAGGGAAAKAALLALVLDNPDVLASINLASIGRSVRLGLSSLPDAVIYSVLRYVNRDGVPLVEQTGERPTGEYDHAFAGNYAELGLAIMRVCTANGFFPDIGTGGGAA